MLLILTGLVTIPLLLYAQNTPTEPKWIWTTEGNALQAAPAGTRYFRQTFAINRDVQKPVDEAFLDITADDAFEVYVNGVKVGSGNTWKRVYRFDVAKLLKHGPNTLAVAATNTSASPAGLLVRLSYTPNGMSNLVLVSDGSWKFATQAEADWEQPTYNDSKWASVQVLGKVGVGPWQKLTWDAGGDERFSVPEGFKVEMLAGPTTPVQGGNPKLPFSLINMTFDAKGRLLVSQERGPTLICEDYDPAKGSYRVVRPFCTQVVNAQGMCWVNDVLYLVGTGPGLSGNQAGLYRCTPNADGSAIAKAELLHRFEGGMAEHGPHAVIHGPDNQLYIVLGNHAWMKAKTLATNSPIRRWPTGQQGPDQGQPGTTEDVLLPRLNDARGHAANIRAPGGTIWRCNLDANEMALVSAGYRNQYDAAFSPNNELFTFDSDMEWDEGLPWYRAVRICHAPDGSDYVWRTGAANTPNYYADSLPPAGETGRGSPVGVTFYDHSAFPPAYRGQFFMADWAIGTIYAVQLIRQGASYQAKYTRFCSGAPMNITDLEVGPDGALYFTLGGRGTPGGIYRVVAVPKGQASQPFTDQPLAAWSRASTKDILARARFAAGEPFEKPALDPTNSTHHRLQCMTLAHIHGRPLSVAALGALAQDNDPEVRASAIYYRTLAADPAAKEALLAALADPDALVQRRACEGLIRLGIEPTVKQLTPLLQSEDAFLRLAARRVLERIDPRQWAQALLQDANWRIYTQAVLALCYIGKANDYARLIFRDDLVNRCFAPDADEALTHLRVAQLALIHTQPCEQRDTFETAFAKRLRASFPSADPRVNREIALLIGDLDRREVRAFPHGIGGPQLLIGALQQTTDRQQQIHYFYSARFIRKGWTEPLKSAVLAWYDSTKDWKGGHSFTPFLENILRDLNPVFTAQDRAAVLAKAAQQPLAALSMLRLATPEQLPSPAELVALYRQVVAASDMPRRSEFKDALLDSLTRSPNRQAASLALGEVVRLDATQAVPAARFVLGDPQSAKNADSYPILVKALEQATPPTLTDIVRGLRGVAVRPKAEDAAAFRAALLASSKLPEKERWQVVELLRHWTNGRQFGSEDGDWKGELSAWGLWYTQSFPKEPSLPNITAVLPAEGKYKYAELLDYLTKGPGKTGNVAAGRLVFTKAQCIKCHKYGEEGEGIGPDLTTASKRFNREYMLESVIYPSKVISDQYRSTTVVTTKGQTYTGLLAPQGEVYSILLQDGTKLTLRKSDIDQQFASLVSVMPERLFDELTLQEIADLFAYLESDPARSNK